MAVTAVKKPPKPAPIDPLDGQCDFIEVPRSWIDENGWPQSFRDLDALAGAETEGFKRLRARRGDIVSLSYQHLDVAYFREGADDKSMLFAQCWRVYKS